MMPSDAIAAIAAQCPLKKDGEPKTIQEVFAGGGQRSKAGGAPVLYLTSDAAMKEFVAQAIAFLKTSGAKAFQIVDGPHVDKWQMTAMKSNGSHRLVEDRYSVSAEIGVFS